MSRNLVLILFPFLAFGYLQYPPVPGELCSLLNPDFKELRYSEQIPYCERNVTTQRKIKICLRDGVEDRTDFTVDHIMPLALGGNNSDNNIWCQHKSLAVTQDEYQLYLKLKNNLTTQKEAINYILKLKFKEMQ